MTKTQLKVLWVGIGLLVLMGLFPPESDGDYNFITEARRLSLSRLCIEWAIVIMLTGGLILTLKYVPELLLRIACRVISVPEQKPYEQRLKDAKEGKLNLTVFWVIVLLLLLLIPLILRLSNWHQEFPYGFLL